MTPDAPPLRRIALPEALDASTAAGLAAEFRAARGAAVELDAAQVRKLGGQGAQVLLAAAAAWRLDHAPLTVLEPSPEFAEALRLMGLSLDRVTAGGAD